MREKWLSAAVVTALAVALAMHLPDSAAAHGGAVNYVLMSAKTQPYDNYPGDRVYGIHGQAYCSPAWPAYYSFGKPNDHTLAMGRKNVSSYYIRNNYFIEGDQLVEIGFANSYQTWNKQGRRDAEPSWIFRAWENVVGNEPYRVRPREEPWYDDRPYVRGQANTWVYFEINNHTMDSNTGTWWAAWNGNAVLRGWRAFGFTRGKAQVAAERWGTTIINGPSVRLDSRFRYLHYKRNAQYQWAPWNGGTRSDTDPYWAIVQQSGYSNYFRVYQDVPYPF